MIETLLVALALASVGGALSWAVSAERSKREVVALVRRVLDLNENMAGMISAADERHRGERERFVQQIVSMRRAGFSPLGPGEGEELESWVLDNAHEAEVSQSRSREEREPLMDLGDPRTF